MLLYTQPTTPTSSYAPPTTHADSCAPPTTHADSYAPPTTHADFYAPPTLPTHLLPHLHTSYAPPTTPTHLLPHLHTSYAPPTTPTHLLCTSCHTCVAHLLYIKREKTRRQWNTTPLIKLGKGATLVPGNVKLSPKKETSHNCNATASYYRHSHMPRLLIDHTNTAALQSWLHWRCKKSKKLLLRTWKLQTEKKLYHLRWHRQHEKVLLTSQKFMKINSTIKACLYNIPIWV